MNHSSAPFFLPRPDAEFIVASGSDVVPLLQGLVLNDLYKLAEPNVGQLNASVNHVGRLISLFRVFHFEDLLMIDAPPKAIEDGLLRHFRTHVITEDAKFKDKSSGVASVLLGGASIFDVLKKLGDKKGLSRDLPQFHVAPLQISHPLLSKDDTQDPVEAILMRTDDLASPDLEGIDTFVLFFPKEVETTIRQILKVEGIVELTPQEFDDLRLQMLSRARWGLELGPEIIPLEADLNPIVSYSKGCYLGQEIIARLDSRNRFAKRLVTLFRPYSDAEREDIESVKLPEVGEDVLTEAVKKGVKRDLAIGSIIATCRTTRSGGGLLLRAYIKRPHFEIDSVDKSPILYLKDDGDKTPQWVVLQVAGVRLKDE